MTTKSNISRRKSDTSNVALIAATSVALLTLTVVTSHQLGYLDHLPDPPGTIFSSDEITESKAAHPLGIPDGLLGLGSYGATLALAVLTQRHRRVRKLLRMKLIADSSVAGVNMVRQLVSFGKMCSWCTGTALCTAVMLVAGRGLIAERDD